MHETMNIKFTHIHINIPEELVVGTLHAQNQQEKQL